ncbi:TonB-dependent receptor [Roseivirga pacifica]|uniref:TonB-dependent receptor n=1 Tax=Roseivirga pacifica TaxID=1267423 RepID=UPI00227D6C82|nr:TonB-dependent receptor [Roseivirga pacifica]
MSINKLITLTLLLFLFRANSLAQVSIKGKVLDFGTGEPIENASIYLSGTSQGMSTDSTGSFEINQVNPGIYELVFSHVAYNNRVEVIETRDVSLTVNARLTIKPVDLETIEVVQQKDKASRRRNLKRFRDFFFGADYMESQAFIRNEQDIDLYDSDGILQSLKEYNLYVENNYLGYELEYYVKQFALAREAKSLLGFPRFTAIDAPNPTTALKWAENRQRSYNGSLRHFFSSLIDQTLEEDNFELFMTPNDPESTDEEEIAAYKEQANRRLQINSKNLPPNFTIESTDFQNIKRINFGEILEINYTNEFDNAGGFQSSKIKLVDEYVYVYTNGVLINPSAIKLFGQMAQEGVYQLLPYDYESNDTLELKDNAERKKLLGNLSVFTETKVVEKVYLHTNREDYYPGETMYIKAYLAAGPNHQPSPLSNNIYVGLLNDKGTEVEKTVLKSENGFANASIEFSEELLPGNYTLVGFSEWMKNNDEAYFFKKEIKINSTEVLPLSPPVVSNAIDLQFLPESGHLLAGVPNKVAFRATDFLGKPVNVSGIIASDQIGDFLRFETSHNGIGTIEFTPKANETYTAKVPKLNQTFKLPQTETNGAIIALDPFYSENEIKINVLGDVKGELFFIGQCRGWLTYTSSIELSNGEAEVIIPKSIFPEGINQVTLFKENGTPIAERLFFSKVNQHLNIDIQLDNETYNKRSKTTAKLTVTDEQGNPVEGSFSLSANNVDRSFVKASNTNIMAHFLLNSDLKGRIDNPSYYFIDPSQEKDQQLDLIMLTHGWTRFEWNELESLTNREVDFPYQKGLTLAGTMLMSDRQKTVKDGTVTFINNGAETPEMLFTTTDKKGNFLFENTSITQKTSFLLQGRTKKNVTLVKFEIDSSLYSLPDISVASFNNILPSVKDESTPSESTAPTEAATFIVKDNKDFLSTVTELEDVVVEAKSEMKTRRESIYGEPTTSLSLENIVPNGRGTGIFDFIKGRIAGVTIRGDGMAATVEIRSIITTTAITNVGPNGELLPDISPLYIIPNENNPTFFLDNVQVPIDVIDAIPASQIERVEVFKGPDAALFGASGSNGVMLFFSKPGYNPFESQSINGIAGYSLNGYNNPKTFYQPLYDVNYSDTGVPDFRIALQWLPNITTDKNGEATVSWFNSDDNDEIEVVVEGLSKMGKTGYTRTSYRITDNNN